MQSNSYKNTRHPRTDNAYVFDPLNSRLLLDSSSRVSGLFKLQNLATTVRRRVYVCVFRVWWCNSTWHALVTATRVMIDHLFPRTRESNWFFPPLPLVTRHPRHEACPTWRRRFATELMPTSVLGQPPPTYNPLSLCVSPKLSLKPRR